MPCPSPPQAEMLCPGGTVAEQGRKRGRHQTHEMVSQGLLGRTE